LLTWKCLYESIVFYQIVKNTHKSHNPFLHLGENIFEKHQHFKSVVLKRFGSWATFVFQKPFAGHKN